MGKFLLLCVHWIITSQNNILYRGVSPDVLMFDQNGYIQVSIPILLSSDHLILWSSVENELT